MAARLLGQDQGCSSALSRSFRRATGWAGWSATSGPA